MDCFVQLPDNAEDNDGSDREWTFYNGRTPSSNTGPNADTTGTDGGTVSFLDRSIQSGVLVTATTTAAAAAAAAIVAATAAVAAAATTYCYSSSVSSNACQFHH